jgi:hypothetical protein
VHRSGNTTQQPIGLSYFNLTSSCFTDKVLTKKPDNENQIRL